MNTINEKNIKLINSIVNDNYIFADSNLIKTIIRNLLSNAIKFTPNDGKIEIGLLDNLKEDSITFYVKDNGNGMDDVQISKLFKIDSNNSTLGTNNERGTGLGLIVCKELIDLHRGYIWAESQHHLVKNYY